MCTIFGEDFGNVTVNGILFENVDPEALRNALAETSEFIYTVQKAKAEEIRSAQNLADKIENDWAERKGVKSGLKDKHRNAYIKAKKRGILVKSMDYYNADRKRTERSIDGDYTHITINKGKKSEKEISVIEDKKSTGYFRDGNPFNKGVSQYYKKHDNKISRQKGKQEIRSYYRTETPDLLDNKYEEISIWDILEDISNFYEANEWIVSMIEDTLCDIKENLKVDPWMEVLVPVLEEARKSELNNNYQNRYNKDIPMLKAKEVM